MTASMAAPITTFCMAVRARTSSTVMMEMMKSLVMMVTESMAEREMISVKEYGTALMVVFASGAERILWHLDRTHAGKTDPYSCGKFSHQTVRADIFDRWQRGMASLAIFCSVTGSTVHFHRALEHIMVDIYGDPINQGGLSPSFGLSSAQIFVMQFYFDETLLRGNLRPWRASCGHRLPAYFSAFVYSGHLRRLPRTTGQAFNLRDVSSQTLFPNLIPAIVRRTTSNPITLAELKKKSPAGSF